ncbi:MAG: tetratricopeptide repeat protein, partial [Deltaproteobacteria bacterium]|nr:tetratricopeptide repeat protein [Deltaproteobacteria bacterium]
MIVAYLVDRLWPSLIFSPATPAGGDTPSHFAAARYLWEVLLPQGRLSGWYPGALAGFPLFQYYFPLPFVLAGALGVVLGPAAGFKLVTIIGALLLPPAAYFFFRRLRAPFPVPIAAAAFSLAFLFNQGNTMWGGNLASTLSGEFCFSLSLSLAVMFLGVLHRAAADGGTPVILPAALLAATGICHAYPLLFCVAGSAWFLGTTSRPAFFFRLAWLARVHGLAFLLLGFWIVPLLAFLPYTTKFSILWHFSSAKGALFSVLPVVLWPGAVLALAWGAWAVFGRKRFSVPPGPAGYVLFLAAMGGLLYFAGYRARVVDVRFLPFFQLFLVMGGAGALSVFTAMAGRTRVCLAVFAVVGTLLVVDHAETFIAPWARTNFSGMEKRALWPCYRAVNDFLSGTEADPRVAYEHSASHARAGTVRAFELLPHFSGRSTLEGVYIQASQTAPFVYYIQSLLSSRPSTPIPDFCYSRFDPDRAVERLALFNVNRLVAVEEETKAALDAHPAYEAVFSAGPYTVYSVETGPARYVTPLASKPALLPEKDWVDAAYTWFRLGDLSVVPVFADSPAPEDADKFLVRPGEDPARWPARPVDAGADAGNMQEMVEAETIRVFNAPVGVPLLVKVSHHPGWKVKGAAAVYRAGPGFMLVVPAASEVTLTYGRTSAHFLGYALTALGAALILLFSLPSLSAYADKVSRLFSAAAPFLLTPALALLTGALFAFLVAGAPTPPSRLYEQGIASYTQKDYAKAREKFAQALLERPRTLTSPEAAYHLAMCHWQEKDWEKALRALDRLLAEYPDSVRAPEAFYHRAMALYHMGEAKKAQKAFARTVTLYPGTSWAGFARERLGDLDFSQRAP